MKHRMICVPREELNCTIHIEVQTVDLGIKHPFLKAKQVQFVFVVLQPLQVATGADRNVLFCFWKRSKIIGRGFTIHWIISLNPTSESKSWEEENMTDLNSVPEEELLPSLSKS